MNEEKVVWGIHNKNNETLLLEDKVIAVGWSQMGDLSKIKADRKSYYEEYEKIYPNKGKRAISGSAGQLYRFVNEAKIGDYIVYPTKFNRMINIGQIEGEYYFDEKEPEYKQKRKVKWIKKIPRSEFTQGALYEIGSFLSFFKVSHYADEFINFVCNKKVNKEDQENVIATYDAMIESTKDYIIKELDRKYKGYELEKVVIDLLKAMGYKTKGSKPGGDNGRDIIVYKDELPPRIIVQVKSEKGNIDEKTVQSLKGAMDEGDYGLFVTLQIIQKMQKNI